MRRGFQTVQGSVAPGSESGTAGRTSKHLDSLGMAMLAIPDQRMNVSLGDPEVRAPLIRTGVAVGVHASGVLPAGFSPHARGIQAEVLALHSTREWRRDDRWGNRVESEAMPQTLERSARLGCCSRLVRTMMGPANGTKQRQREDEKEQEQKHM